MADFNIDEYVKKAEEALKDSPEKLKEVANNSSLLKEILGDDGKLSKDDLDRIVGKVKDSGFAKSILGDDGKFDMSDVSRIADNAKEAGEGLLNKAKDLFGGKSEE